MFDEEVRCKGRIAAGARHKKRRGRGCTLPSDCLTPSQLRRLNGRVRTYRLDIPLCRADVEALPEDLRREYLTRLRDGFSLDARMLSAMLGTTCRQAEEMMEALGVRQGTPDEEALRRWEDFCQKEGGREG